MKEKSNKSTNAADNNSDNKDTDNYAIIAINYGDDSDDDTPNVALVVTSRHNHDIYAASNSTGILIDCSASSHFLPDKDKFSNYHTITPEPIKAADGHTFSAIEKGNLKIKLPTCSRNKPMTVTLQGVYYAPSMAFTLISVSCLDHAGCLVLIEDGVCIIHGSYPERKFLGSVPQIHGLYHVNPRAVVSPYQTTTLMQLTN